MERKIGGMPVYRKIEKNGRMGFKRDGSVQLSVSS
jgi:hypothetical protein